MIKTDVFANVWLMHLPHNQALKGIWNVLAARTLYTTPLSHLSRFWQKALYLRSNWQSLSTFTGRMQCPKKRGKKLQKQAARHDWKVKDCKEKSLLKEYTFRGKRLWLGKGQNTCERQSCQTWTNHALTKARHSENWVPAQQFTMKPNLQLGRPVRKTL